MDERLILSISTYLNLTVNTYSLYSPPPPPPPKSSVFMLRERERGRQTGRERQTESSPSHPQHILINGKAESIPTFSTLVWEVQKKSAQGYQGLSLFRKVESIYISSTLLSTFTLEQIIVRRHLVGRTQKGRSLCLQSRLKVRSHQKQNYFSRRPKRVSLLARPFTVFKP